MNHERFREMCAVVKLEYCEPDCVASAANSASSSLFSPTLSIDDGVSSGVAMGRMGEDWRRCVLDGNWARSADDMLVVRVRGREVWWCYTSEEGRPGFRMGWPGLIPRADGGCVEIFFT